MSTRIAWTDETWNVVTGCTPVSAGCAHCYAAAFARRQMGQWKGRKFSEVRCHPERLSRPLHWRKPRRVFVNSMSDLFHPEVPDPFLDRVFAVMALAPQHTFQILTKRPERLRDYLCNTRGADGVICRVNTAGREIPKGNWWRGNSTSYPWENVWLGVSVEDQATADARIRVLLDTPATLRFVSCEPLLSPVCLYGPGRPTWNQLNGIDWLIVGGESGPEARPCHVAWIEALLAQCAAAEIPAFVKQLGAYPWWAGADTQPITHARGAYANPQEWPPDLRVREWPL